MKIDICQGRFHFEKLSVKFDKFLLKYFPLFSTNMFKLFKKYGFFILKMLKFHFTLFKLDKIREIKQKTKMQRKPESEVLITLRTMLYLPHTVLKRDLVTVHASIAESKKELGTLWLPSVHDIRAHFRGMGVRPNSDGRFIPL